MLTKITKWVSIAGLLLLALLWPWSAGYQILAVFFAFCTGAILAQASWAGKYFWKAGHAVLSREVKYEN